MSAVAQDSPVKSAPHVKNVEKLAPEAGRGRRMVRLAPRIAAAAEPPPGSEIDPRVSLENLRHILVGPAMQLNEARLDQLVTIMEERDAQFRAAIFDLEARLKFANDARDADMRSLESEFTQKLESAVAAAVDVVNKRHEELRAEVRNGLGETRQQAQKLSEHFELWVATIETHMSGKIGALTDEMNGLIEQLSARIASGRKATMNELGRAVGSLAEMIVREGERPAS